MDALLSLLSGGQNILFGGVFVGGRISGASRERDKQAPE
jgi:hypothetical protein